MDLIPGVPKALAAGALQANQGVLRGIAIRETAGAAATVRLFDNASAGSGTLLGAYNLAALGTVDLDYPRGRQFVNGVFAVITGTVEGSIFV